MIRPYFFSWNQTFPIPEIPTVPLGDLTAILRLHQILLLVCIKYGNEMGVIRSTHSSLNSATSFHLMFLTQSLGLSVNSKRGIGNPNSWFLPGADTHGHDLVSEKPLQSGARVWYGNITEFTSSIPESKINLSDLSSPTWMFNNVLRACVFIIIKKIKTRLSTAHTCPSGERVREQTCDRCLSCCLMHYWKALKIPQWWVRYKKQI